METVYNEKRIVVIVMGIIYMAAGVAAAVFCTAGAVRGVDPIVLVGTVGGVGAIAAGYHVMQLGLRGR